MRAITSFPATGRPPSPLRFDQLGDDVADGHALGAGGEGERHAMLQDRLGERVDVIDRRREATLVEGAGAGAERQCLAGARAWTPGDIAAHFVNDALGVLDGRRRLTHDSEPGIRICDDIARPGNERVRIQIVDDPLHLDMSRLADDEHVITLAMKRLGGVVGARHERARRIEDRLSGRGKSGSLALADAVRGVRTLTRDELSAPPATVSAIAAKFLEGVSAQGLVVLDLGQVLMDPNIVVNDGDSE